jgi:hypothetical protein
MNDHDLLLEIAGNVKAIHSELKRGTEVMADHEFRLRVQEKCASDAITRAHCDATHKALNARYSWLVGVLLIASLSLTAALITELLNRT